jgi:hypothetical protein
MRRGKPVTEPSKQSVPTLRYPADRRSRVQRWRDAVASLQALQNDYQAWLEALPENMADGATAEALRAICDLDLSELQSIVPPKGLGRNRSVARCNL